MLSLAELLAIVGAFFCIATFFVDALTKSIHTQNQGERKCAGSHVRIAGAGKQELMGHGGVLMANESTVASRYPALDVARYRSASPSLVDTLLEGARTMSEAATLTVIWRWLRHHSRVQDHREQPVMVLPGFLGGDASTIVLRRFLGDLGFTVHPWLLGTNDGTERLQNELLRRFLRLSQTYKRPIALVGHSLGGVFARELARQFPQQVSQVITLGSPFAIADPNSVNRLVSLLFERISGESVEDKRISMLHAEPHHPF